MPKVIYEPAKGLYQVAGEGIDFSNQVVQVSAIKVSIATTSQNYNITNETILLCNANTGNITISLPNANAYNGQVLYIKKVDATGFQINITGTSNQTIDGESNKIINAQYTTMQLVAANGNWHIL